MEFVCFRPLILPPKCQTQLRQKRSCVRAKKKRQPSAIASAGAVRSQGLVNDRGIVFGAFGTDDLRGAAEVFLGAVSGIVEQSNIPKRRTRRLRLFFGREACVGIRRKRARSWQDFDRRPRLRGMHPKWRHSVLLLVHRPMTHRRTRL